jgi:hypothetical protein
MPVQDRPSALEGWKEGHDWELASAAAGVVVDEEVGEVAAGRTRGGSGARTATMR